VICNVETFGEFAAAATLILNAAVAVWGVADESFACTENAEEPDAVGVPEIAPVELLSVKPAGSEPEATLQVYGVVPPVAATAALYAFLT
jgi:hypothetical protein